LTGANPLILEVRKRLKEVRDQELIQKIWLYYELVKQCPDVGLPEIANASALRIAGLGEWRELQQRRGLRH